MPNYNYGYPYGYQQQMQQVQQPTMIDVRSEDEMNRYPVAPGSSVTFRNLAEPYFYVKTMVSQYGQPVVEKFKRIEENVQKNEEYATKAELAALAQTVSEIVKKAKQDE